MQTRSSFSYFNPLFCPLSKGSYSALGVVLNPELFCRQVLNPELYSQHVCKFLLDPLVFSFVSASIRSSHPPLCCGSIAPFLTVCMTLPGGGCRLQTCRGLAAQWFDSTLRTLLIILIPSWIERVTVPNVAELTLISIRSLIGLTTMQYPCIIRYH